MAQMFIQQNPSNYQLANAMVQPQQQQQQQGPNPMQGWNMYQKFAGGGAGGASAAGSNAMADAGVQSYLGGLTEANLTSLGGGGSAAGGGSSAAGQGGSALASAGPWAALAAVILGNESRSRDQGYRDEDWNDQLVDALGGKVLEQDVDKFAEKGGFEGTMLNDSMQFGADVATGDFSNAWKLAKEESPLLRGFRSIF